MQNCKLRFNEDSYAFNFSCLDNVLNKYRIIKSNTSKYDKLINILF